MSNKKIYKLINTGIISYPYRGRASDGSNAYEVLKKGDILIESSRLGGPIVKYKNSTYMIANGEVYRAIVQTVKPKPEKEHNTFSIIGESVYGKSKKIKV
jgi:hypothetical protein